MKAALGGLAAAAILGLGAVSASAAPNPGFGSFGTPIDGTGYHNPYPNMNNPFTQAADGPETANVPTLAWVGEDVRLVACDNNILPEPFDGQFQQAEWNTNLWTGDQATQSTPTFDGSQATNLFVTDQGSPYFFTPTLNSGRYQYKGCVSADISSLHAGLDEVTLNVYNESVDGGNGNGGGGNTPSIKDPGGPVQTVAYSEQYIIIWMTANTPKITESSLNSIEFPTQAGDNGTQSTAVFPSTGPYGPDKDGASVGQLSGTGVVNAGNFLGDTAVLNQFGLDAWGADKPFYAGYWDGNANNTPASNNGLVQVRVTGTFPIEDQIPATTNEQFFSGITGGGNPGFITLPNSWPALASLMAASSTSYEGAPMGGNLWDIHGGPTNPLTHAENQLAPSSYQPCQYDGTVFNTTPPTDAVDDCADNGGVGDAFAFSRVFGDMTTFGTVGPYDALDPTTTLLSDGRLNTDDAPMPALPVTVSLANSDGSTPIGGLYGVSKYLVYSHDFDGGPSTFDAPKALTTTGLGNLYNPYYQEYIPSTTRPIAEASGITGVYQGGFPATSGDDFPGFSLGFTSPYTFWTALDASTTDTAGSNGCLRRSDGNSWTNPQFYQKPYYPTNVTVYTDERGEAYVDYNPGTGFDTPNVHIDLDGSCDLQALLGKPIGSAGITAQAQYPYESVPYAPVPKSNTITKTVISQWSKTVTAYPKGNASGEGSVIVASATDVNGSPLTGETVCFAASNGGNLGPVDPQSSITTPSGSTISLAGDYASTDTDVELGVGPTYFCGVTGSAGTVGVDLTGSIGAVDITVLFWNEGLFRDITVDPGQSTTVTSTTPPTVIPAFKVNLQSGSSATTNSGSTAGGETTTGQVTIQTAIPGNGASCKVAAFHMFAKRDYATVRLSCTGTKSDYVLVRTFKGRKLVQTTKVKIKAGTTVRLHFAKGRRITVSA